MTVPPPLPHYNPAPAAKEDGEHFGVTRWKYLAILIHSILVDWAEIPVVDLSIAVSPEGREILMPLVRDAMHTHGFMYVIDHGLTPAQVWVFNSRSSTVRCHTAFDLSGNPESANLSYRRHPVYSS